VAVVAPRALYYIPAVRWATLCLVLLTTACGLADPRVPRGVLVGQPREGTQRGTCPPIAGAYRRADNVLGTIMTAALPYESRDRDWTIVVIAQPTDTTMILTYRTAVGVADTVRLRLPADYECNSGWIEPGFAWLRLPDPYRAPNDYRHIRDDFRIAANDDQHLVGQRIIRRYRQFDVWCGDGCKGFPLPWTVRREVQYHTMLDTLAPIPPPVSSEPRPPGVQSRSAREEAANRRMAAEEAALEAGTPPSNRRQ
jgi:hypothetical protein